MSKTEQKGIKAFTKRNPEVLTGTTIVIGSFVIVEICTEFIMAIIWSINVKDSIVDLIVFAAAIVYYGPGIFSLYKIGKKYYLYHSGHYENSKNKGNFNDKKVDKSDDTEENIKHDVFFKCFVWTGAYFFYVLLYSFFPAFILAFAYPIRTLIIFAFVSAFIVLSIIYLTTYIKKGVTLKVCKNNNYYCNNLCLKVSMWIILVVTLVYFFLFVFALLYSLVIGRASVVSSAPLAVLSLLPSVLISVTAWILKSTILDNNTDETSDGKNCHDETNIRDTEGRISNTREGDRNDVRGEDILNEKAIGMEQNMEVVGDNSNINTCTGDIGTIETNSEV